MRGIASVSLLATYSFLLRVSFADDFAWKVINDSTALCNDYTPAGYFVASGRTPEHWVIFLESGGGCYSPTTCNARYFNESVRTKFKSSGSLSVGPLVSYDVFKAKSSVLSAGETLSDFVSPLVTSMLTFQNTSYFNNGRLSVQGQGILDDNCTNNPIFCNHTRVIIPYCSSDLWLANSPSFSCNISKDLYDQCYANVQSSCVAIGEMYFKNCFLSSSNQLSFVFRGQAIYRGALQQLLGKGLANSSTVTLVGSSAGGVGVVNHAKWTLQLLRNGTRGANLSVIADSSWFINFQDNVYKLFVGLSSNGSVQSGGVFSIITATDTTSVTCKDITHGTPCCFSAFCMLSTPEYYPSKDVSTFMLFGLYDVYLLAQSLIGLNISEVGQKNSGAGLAVKFIQTVSEYGGAMNDSLSVSSRRVARLSYYVTQCFQHIYLVTSTLWGVGNLLGNQAVDISASFASYNQFMNPSTWSSMEVGVNKTTIRDALSQWYPNRYSSTIVTIRDSCSGPHCNSMCPETIILGTQLLDIWSPPVHVLLLVLVLGVALFCLLAKASFWLWYLRIDLKQRGYLRGLLNNMEDSNLQFPDCADEHGVSVSCLDLHYSVTVRTTKVKDEKKDDTAPVVLRRLHSEPQGHTDDATKIYATTPVAFKSIHEYLIHYAKRKSEVILNQQPPPPPPTTDRDFYTTKEILKGISIYFNPGDLCAIMGPSGCGKTTLLDLLTGRRTAGNIGGHIFVNGLSIEQIKDWYVANTGYVLQLATPYYEELTVRENLTLAAQIKLPNSFTLREKFTRVEQVLAVSELRQYGDTVVGGASGPGLSGGQKRRLAIALQLLKLPSVLFLDEPTSGLDATSSYELLTHLNRLADSKRTIILTIHQPRLEIFHMFNRLVLLTDGKCGVGWCGMVWDGVVWDGVVWDGVVWDGVVWDGVVWDGVVWDGVVWDGVVWDGVVWDGVVWDGVVWDGVVWDGVVWDGVVWDGVVWDGVVWDGVVWDGVVWDGVWDSVMWDGVIWDGVVWDGVVAYHGVPERAYEVFIKALQAKYWRDAPRLENENPADVIMDVAGNHKLRAIITGYYERSSDPQLVRDAIKKACSNSKSKSREILDTVTNKVQYAIYGAKRVGNHQGGVFNRLAALEARGAKRASFGQMLYLPAIFFAYGVLLGTVYYQSYSPLLVMSGFCVYSVASALFMFPALYLYYQRALEVYAYEHADGVGSPWDIVIQGFIRGITLGFFPVILCAAILYLLLVNHNSYNFAVFGQVLLINLALNQTWVALLIFIICAFPKIAFRLSPIISSVAGFTSGFFVPREAMPPYYSWLFYINPNYYGFSASANILLNNFNTGCVGSVFECFPSSPQYYLKYFNFDDVNPYLHITILLGFTLLYILLATLSNSIRYSNYASNIKRLAHLLTLQHEANSEGSDITNDHSRENSISEDIVLEPVNHETERHGLEDAPSIIEVHKEEEGRQSEPVVAASNGVKMNPKVRWQRVAEKCAKSRPSACEEQTEEELSAERRSLFLREGEGHVVWKPKDKGQQMRLALVVGQVLDMPRTLSERRKNLEKRVQATRAVLRADSKPSMEQHPQSTRRRMTFKDAANKVKTDLHNSEHYHFHDVVSQYVARMHNERKSFDNTASLVTLSAPPERHVRSKATPTRVDETPPTLPSENLSLVGSFPGDLSEGNAIDVGDLSQNSPSKGASQDSLVKQLPSASPVKNRFSGCATLVASTARSRLERSRQQQNREAVKGTYHESWC
ncbi:hypothetical protein EMCRGX_G026851 [Ephydatia muelleri]